MAERERRPFSSKSTASTSRVVDEGGARDASGSRFAHVRSPDPGEAALRERPPLVMAPVVAADEVAQMALMLRAEADAKGTAARCDACDAEIEGEPAGSGLYLWTRGDDDLRLEEPPLCEGCATAIGATALRRWDEEDEEEG